MKTYFNDIYLPVKRGVTGHIFGEKHSLFTDLISEIQVNFEPDKPIGKWVINAVFKYKNQGKCFHYGKTIKEIKALVNDINDFKYDPLLFLNS